MVLRAKDVGARINVDEFPVYCDTELRPFMQRRFGDFSLQEVKEAFEAALAGDLTVDIKHYGEFGKEYVARILRAYRGVRNKGIVKIENSLPEAPKYTKDDVIKIYEEEWKSFLKFQDRCINVPDYKLDDFVEPELDDFKFWWISMFKWKRLWRTNATVLWNAQNLKLKTVKTNLMKGMLNDKETSKERQKLSKKYGQLSRGDYVGQIGALRNAYEMQLVRLYLIEAWSRGYEFK